MRSTAQRMNLRAKPSLRRIWAASSLFLFNGALFLYLWWGKMQYRHETYLGVAYGVCIVLILAGHWVFADGRRRLGLRLDNVRPAVRAYGALTLGGAILISTAGLMVGDFDPAGIWSVAPYLLWAGLQQYTLQGFVRPRIEDLLIPRPVPGEPAEPPSRISLRRLASALLAAGVFAMLHWPSPLLVSLTFIAGVAWCLLFVRVPSLPGVWLSHATLGILLVLFFKQGTLGSFQVGLPGFRFESYGEGAQVAAGRDASGDPVIVTLPGPDLGNPSLVRVFDDEGRKRAEWVAFPEFDFSGRVAVGDLGFADGDEIAVVPGPAPVNPPLVRIFNTAGRLLQEFAVPDLPRTYGAFVSIHCGRLYLSAGPGPGAPARVVACAADGTRLGRWVLDGKTGFVNAINATAFERPCRPPRDTDLLVWGSAVAVNSSQVSLVRQGRILESFDTLPTTFGVNLAVLSLGPDRTGVAVAPGPLAGYPPWVRVYGLRGGWSFLHEFVPSADEGTAGANLAAVDIDGDGQDELVMGEGTAPGRPPTVRIVRLDGTLLRRWNAY